MEPYNIHPWAAFVQKLISSLTQYQTLIISLGLGAVLLGSVWMLWRSLKPNRWLKSLKGRLQTNYVAQVLSVGVALFGLAFWFYLWGTISSLS